MIAKFFFPEFKSNVFSGVVPSVKRTIRHACVRCDLREGKTIDSICRE
jgi:hypothetical protein